MEFKPYKWETLNFKTSFPRLWNASFRTFRKSNGLSTFSCVSSTKKSEDPMQIFNEFLPDSCTKSRTYINKHVEARLHQDKTYTFKTPNLKLFMVSKKKRNLFIVEFKNCDRKVISRCSSCIWIHKIEELLETTSIQTTIMARSFLKSIKNTIMSTSISEFCGMTWWVNVVHHNVTKAPVQITMIAKDQTNDNKI